MIHGHANIDFGLLDRLTSELLCSRCLLDGVRSPVTQVVSKFHRPRTLCPTCRARKLAGRPATVHRLNA